MRLRIQTKFLIVFAVLVPVIFAVPVVGVHGLGTLRGQANLLYEDIFKTSRVTQDLATSVDDAQALTLQLVLTRDRAYQERLDADLLGLVVPRVDGNIRRVRRKLAHGSPAERGRLRRLDRRWRRFVALARAGAFDTAGSSGAASASNDRLARRARSIFAPITSAARAMTATEGAEGKETAEAAGSAYSSSRDRMLVFASLATLVGLIAMLWLIRNVVPRMRDYARFAARVASGQASEPVSPRGTDELADLGHTLNDMVARRQTERAFEETQVEFADAMQVTESEREAHGLLKRHLERSIENSDVVVMNRNNSHDRLEATTPLDPASDLGGALADAGPRSCLAVRFGRGHEEGGDRAPLLECELCGARAAEWSSCEPLLVSGEVIGSVLVQRAGPLDQDDHSRIKTSVVQAAPVLANLRNLAIAELRASTDALTGLPNNRALQESMKRMVAHAARSDTSLATILLDLDHFKKVNDTYGHGKGDEVLAAVGAVLESTARESDLAGRWGGEEFLVLLPGADREGAVVAAEKLRKAIAAITVVGVDTPIRASLGVAVMPDDASDVTMLVRNADRALYSAKARGRDRVEAFASQSGNGVPLAHPV